jgi:hypothetical protein
MCLFHVIKNCKEHLKGVDEKIKSQVVIDINYLHFLRNQFEFKIAKYNLNLNQTIETEYI